MVRWHRPERAGDSVSLLLIDLNFFAPGVTRIDRVEALEIIAFLIVSVTITATMEALHRALALAETRSRELKRLNEEVGRSYDAERERRHVAELVAQAREEALGVVAHDLRNPLNLITSTADMLLNEETAGRAPHRAPRSRAESRPADEPPHRGPSGYRASQRW